MPEPEVTVTPEQVPVEPAIEPIAEPAQDQIESPDPVHPLEPGGKRFQQVWKRAKSAEERYHNEREARIAAEAKLQTLKEVGLSPDGTKRTKEYTWSELEEQITEGKITRAEALDYRDAQIIRKAKDEAKREFQQEFESRTTSDTVDSQLARYKELAPDAMEEGTTTRERLEQEFAWQVRVHGQPKTPAEQRKLELATARTVLGSVESLERRARSADMTRETRETSMDTTSGSKGRNPAPKPDDENTPPKGLTADQIEHYQKMFQKSSAYPRRWADVRKELAYQRPVLARAGR